MGKKGKVGKDRKDKFYKLAKETGFRSRAAFKLIQLNRKFSFLQKSQVCIDLCAAPGGWMQVAKENMPISSIVIGVDLYPIKSINGCTSLVEDITTDKCRTSLKKELQTWKADVVLHDGAPNVGKNWLYDAYQQICLTLQATKLASEFLRSGGWFITKVFRSKDYNALLWVLKQLFKKVHATKPSASRKESAEIFVVCQYFIAPDKIDPRFFDAKYVFEELDLEGTKTVSLLHPEKKRIKPEGYSEKDFSLRNELKASEFIKSTSALSALQGVSEIVLDDEKIASHEKTTNEIKECCKDIKVLGRKDLKNLISWWKVLNAEFYPKEQAKVVVETIDTEEKKKPLTQEEVEEMEFEEIEKQIEELETENLKDQKRKKKKVQEARRKLNEKINLKMVIKGDSGPQEEDSEVFSLRQINSAAQLESIQDMVPDMYLPEDDTGNSEYIPKYKKYERDSCHLDDDGLYADDDDNENDSDDNENNDSDDSENLGEKGLGFDDESDQDHESPKKKSDKKKVKKVKKGDENPLLMDLDVRDKSTKRDQRVNLWFDKEKFKEMDADSDDGEDFDLDKLSHQYKTKGVRVLGESSEKEKEVKQSLGKKALRRQKYKKDAGSDGNDTSDSDSDDDGVANDDGSGVKVKKIKLNEQELALGSMIVQSQKTKRDLFDAAWNRYTFNDENLPEWFVKDEAQHMVKEAPVPKELVDEYQKKVEELNVRPIKKVMEAKARKKRRAMKRFEKAKKKAESIMESNDASAQEKMRQIRKLYKKAQDKKEDITYVVARKHLSSKRVRRPAGVKGRFKAVDPRMKKEKRAAKAKEKTKKRRKH